MNEKEFEFIDIEELEEYIGKVLAEEQKIDIHSFREYLRTSKMLDGSKRKRYLDIIKEK